jgi:hypothetical protein
MYALTAETLPTKPTPVVIGCNWYEGFDEPELRDRHYWIGRGRDWGAVRGGHAVCLLPPGVSDRWWGYYDQGNEGACAGFSSSRMMSLLNRERYNGFSLYEHAKRVDDWPGENYSGTSVRAVMDVLRDFGPYDRRGLQDPRDGIIANRWARNVEDIAYCLSPADNGLIVLNRGYGIVLNSWGDDPEAGSPHYPRLPWPAIDRLVFQEDGEATVVTDR